MDAQLLALEPSPGRKTPTAGRKRKPDIYLVLDDFGRMGCAWRETNVEVTDFEAVIDDLWEGRSPSGPTAGAEILIRLVASATRRLTEFP
jgi:hypothetical protein